MGEGEKRIEGYSQIDAGQANDVSFSPSQDCSGSTGEMGEGQGEKDSLNQPHFAEF
jgi:hypothetical protein